METKNINHWKEFPETCQTNGFQKLWRTHSDAVNGMLLNRWWQTDRFDCSLKTDLFDEAVNHGLIPFLMSRSKKLCCIDTSFGIHQMAKNRYPSLCSVTAEVRCLPFPDSTFDSILSNSTLDHFESMNDLSMALKELHRLLRPGGQMILTLDNPSNPVVCLRNHLSFRLLRRLKIIPYYVGRTLKRKPLKQLLEDTGFQILETDAILHCPRILAVILSRWMESYASPRLQNVFLSFLMVFEKLSRFPTRFLTGYYIAVKCIKS